MTRTVALLLALWGMALGCGETPATGAADLAAPLEVQVATVRVRAVANEIAVVGSLTAQETLTVSPEIGGIVAEVAVDFGDRIERGALLLRLEATELALRAAAARAGLAQAEAIRAQARANHDRATALHRQQVMSAGELDAATRELGVAEANCTAAAQQVAIAEKHVADAVLYAPVSGFVAARRVTAGQYVMPYAPVLDLVVVDPLKLHVDVPERFVAALRPGLALRATLDAFAGETFAGTVTRIGSAVDPSTRTLRIEGTIPNPDGRLKPGQFAHATLDLGRQEAPVVPRAAVETFAGSHRAFVVHPDGRVEARPIVPGRDLGEDVVVLDGVRAGEVVATSHLERLSDGARVAVPPS
jgi:membrane fusion protein (multidrug efflux system)